MPLTVNVGLSRKASKDYQSCGFSINLTAELDQSLLSDPDALQQQVDQLYQQAEEALERQVKPPSTPAKPAHDTNDRRRNDNHSRRASFPTERRGNNGRGDRSRGNGRSRHMTDSQRRAIHTISDRLDIDAADEAHHEFGFDLDRISVSEASQLIQHLKAMQESGKGGGN